MKRVFNKKRDVFLIAFSAFFADLGYQAILAGYPLFLVLGLSAPVYIFGFAEAIGYGGGAIFSYIGGRLGDKYGRKKVAIAGNSLIPLLSFIGLANTVPQAVSLFVGGWWSRNFRSPVRRAIMSDITDVEERKRAFGLLHALDVGGGVIAVVYASLMIMMGLAFSLIFIVTIIPLVISTILLAMVNSKPLEVRKKEVRVEVKKNRSGIFKMVVIATIFFGFSYYSFGFPIITIAQSTHVDYLAMLGYGLFLASSSITGYFIGNIKIKELTGLAFSGYLLAAIANLGFAFLFKCGIEGLYPAVITLGVSTGMIETMEPTIISKVIGQSQMGKGMGTLGMGRSIGLFFGNILMGILYTISYFYSYMYGFITSLISFFLIIVAMFIYGNNL